MSKGQLKKVYTVEEIKRAVEAVAADYGVSRVLLFGSYARGEANPESDIDLRIDKGKLRGLFQLSGFRIELEERLNINVDVLTTESLEESFLNRIRSEEVTLYEQ